MGGGVWGCDMDKDIQKVNMGKLIREIEHKKEREVKIWRNRKESKGKI